MQRDPDGRETRAIEKILGSCAGDLLEVGCGDGRLTEVLLNLSSTLYAIDPDAVTITRVNGYLGNKVRFIIGSGEDLPFSGTCFDTVVFSLSLHHQDPFRALAEACRILGEEGRILVLEPAGDSLFNRLFRILHDEDEEYAKVESAVRQCGLLVEDSGAFTSDWVFRDFEEMADHMFSYFDLSPDPIRAGCMEEILGNRKTAQPLSVEDTTNFWILQSDSPS